MWIIVERTPVPDAAYWPGRRCLAAVDALAWPVAVGLLLSQVQGKTGILVPTVTAVLALLALRRLHRALWANHRYRFTTWTVGRILLALVFVGAVLKLTLT